MPPVPSAPDPPLPRLITYYQTHHTPEGKPISVLPLLQQPGIALTHLILAAIHINEDPAALTLNDHPPSHPRFATLWAELRVLQASGVKVLGMLGGAAKGSFARLDVQPPSDVDGDNHDPQQPQQLPPPQHQTETPEEATARFERYYLPLATLIRTHALDGLDLDVEEPTSLPGIIHLIDRLRSDFGPAFLITLAPVASALLSARHNLSGFDYEALEVLRGKEIAWYNAQFYCGWGDCSNPALYEMLLAKGWPAEKVVVGMVTNPRNGSGWVPWHALAGVVPLLVGRHPRFGGVMGWEYFNGLPGGEERPWEWPQAMTGLLRGRRALPGGVADEVERREREVDRALAVVDPDGGDGLGEGDEVTAPLPGEFEYHSDGPGLEE